MIVLGAWLAGKSIPDTFRPRVAPGVVPPRSRKFMDHGADFVVEPADGTWPALLPEAFLAGVSGTTLSGTAQPVLVKANAQLDTASSASNLGSDAAPGIAVGKLRAHVRRQDKKIAALTQEVARLSSR